MFFSWGKGSKFLLDKQFLSLKYFVIVFFFLCVAMVLGLFWLFFIGRIGMFWVDGSLVFLREIS